jgi:excisionase family DNA binding protein
MSKSYLTVEDVAQRFGVNTITIYRLVQKKKLPAFKIGGQWRFEKKILDAWVADRMTTSWMKTDSE